MIHFRHFGLKTVASLAIDDGIGKYYLFGRQYEIHLLIIIAALSSPLLANTEIQKHTNNSEVAAGKGKLSFLVELEEI
jgi:hypothetical protein